MPTPSGERARGLTNGMGKETQMFFEPFDVAKLSAMTGYLLSATIIASVILNGNRPPL